MESSGSAAIDRSLQTLFPTGFVLMCLMCLVRDRNARSPSSVRRRDRVPTHLHWRLTTGSLQWSIFGKSASWIRQLSASAVQVNNSTCLLQALPNGIPSKGRDGTTEVERPLKVQVRYRPDSTPAFPW